MHINRNISRVLAAAVASAGFFVAPMPAFATQLVCTSSSFTATADGSGNITVSCTQAGSPPPSSCSVNVNPTTVPASGGTVTITTNCGSSTSVTGGKALQASSSTTWVDTIPANTGTSSLTFTYNISGANGSNQASVLQLASGSSGGGTTGPISCPGYTNTLVYDLPWSALSKVTTKGFSNSTFVVGRFTTPATSVVSASATIFSGQWTEPTVVRTGAISTSPCDLTGQGTGAVSPGVSQGPSWTYQINGTALRFSGRIVLQPSTTYYFNLTNRDKNGAATCTAASCEMILQLTIPTGL
ncbi:MAG TPA: hypothetical protein VN858_07780 [Casimicrobiaceae bacterium]|nr:hypothetical protein [Casimicrobiaceae bacterium]